MKHLFRCLAALLCIAALTVSALADVIPGGIVRRSSLGTVLLVGLVVIALAVVCLIVRKHKK